MKVLFGSVVYQGAMGYFDSFINSISKQTEKEFTLLLINDGVSSGYLAEKMKDTGILYEIVEYDKQFTPVELRIRLLEESCQRKADFLIMGDADDTFSEKRVEECVKAFLQNEDAGFVYNALCLFDGSRVMPDLPDMVNKPEDILECNFLGLSNTAIKMRGISLDFINSLNECKSFVFDWYLYSRLLLMGFHGIRVPDAYTFYRVHNNNYAGLPFMTEEAVQKEIEVKRRHYDTLKDYDWKYEKLADCYRENNIVRNPEQRHYYWWNFTSRRS